MSNALRTFLALSFLGNLLLSPTTMADYLGDLSQKEALAEIRDGKITVVDVRTPAEFATGHVPGAINIPYDEIDSRLAALPAHDQPLLLYCRSGRRADSAQATLTKAGYTKLYHLQGDMISWAESEQPIEK